MDENFAQKKVELTDRNVSISLAFLLTNKISEGR